MHYASAAGLRAVLERCWLGSMLGSADFVRCRSGLGLVFWRIFCISSLANSTVAEFSETAKPERLPPTCQLIFYPDKHRWH